MSNFGTKESSLKKIKELLDELIDGRELAPSHHLGGNFVVLLNSHLNEAIPILFDESINLIEASLMVITNLTNWPYCSGSLPSMSG